jgi:hypothetical protein
MAKKKTKKATSAVKTKITKASEVAPTEQWAAVDSRPWIDPASITRGICRVERQRLLEGNEHRKK